MKTKKRFFTLMLALALAVCMAVPAFASYSSTKPSGGSQGFAAYANSCRLHKLEELQHEKKYKVVCLMVSAILIIAAAILFCLGLPSAGSKRTANDPRYSDRCARR